MFPSDNDVEGSFEGFVTKLDGEIFEGLEFLLESYEIEI